MTQLMYAMKRGNRFVHFYPSVAQVNMCGTGPIFIVSVSVDETEKDDYWGWYENESKKINFIYSDELLVRMCFPDLAYNQEKQGRGKVIRVKVEVNRDAIPEEI